MAFASGSTVSVSWVSRRIEKRFTTVRPGCHYPTRSTPRRKRPPRWPGGRQPPPPPVAIARLARALQPRHPLAQSVALLCCGGAGAHQVARTVGAAPALAGHVAAVLGRP